MTFSKAISPLARPVIRRVQEAEPEHYGSDCPMAGRMIQHGLGDGESLHPMSMVRKAYGI